MKIQYYKHFVVLGLCMLTSSLIYSQTETVVRNRICVTCKQVKPVSDFSGDSQKCRACVKKAHDQAEKERIAREQAEKERIARERAEKERIAREQAEKERIAREQAEKERLALVEKEKKRIAQLNELGYDYYLGKNGKKRDYSEAIKCYQETAKFGDFTSKNNLACSFYQQNHSFWEDHPKSYYDAWDYIHSCAESGNAVAQNNYAIYLEKTHKYARSKKHFETVLTWLLRAANQDDVYAMYNIGSHFRSYATTTDIVSNRPLFNKEVMDRKAREWYLKAADKGFKPAQNELSIMLKYGWGGNKDKKQAKYWQEKAEAQGYEYLENSPFHLFYYD